MGVLTLPSPPRPSSQTPLLLWPTHVSLHVVLFTKAFSQGNSGRDSAVWLLLSAPLCCAARWTSPFTSSLFADRSNLHAPRHLNNEEHAVLA